MSNKAVEVLAKALDMRYGTTSNWAKHIIATLKAAGITLVEVSTVDEQLESNRLGPDGSIFDPESLQQIRDRLAFIGENYLCDCEDTPHMNALHDLACDDVPALLRIIDRLPG